MQSARSWGVTAAPIKIGLVALLVGTVANASVAGIEDPNATPAADPIAVADRSVLRIIVRTPVSATMGSGFVINGQHMMITTRHVVDGATGIVVLEPVDGENRPHEARVLAADVARDLAVLVVPSLERAPLTLRGQPPVKGERAIALGFPGFGDRNMDMLGDTDFTESTRTTGEVSRLIREPWHSDQPALTMVQHTASINQGSSGGPLLDDCGRVIGVNTQILDPRLGDGINFASSAAEVIAFLREREIPHRTSTGDCGAELLDVSLASMMPERETNSTAKIATISAITVSLLLLLFWHYRRSVRAEQMARRGAKPTVDETESGEPSPPVATVAACQEPRTLIVHGRTSEGRRFRREIRETDLLRGGILIGRDRTCSHVFVPDPGVSRRHARIAITDGHLTIEDLGSTNGTFIGPGPAIAAHSPIPIRLETTIRVAKCNIRLSENQPRVVSGFGDTS